MSNLTVHPKETQYATSQHEKLIHIAENSQAMGQSPVMCPLGLMTSLAPSVDSQKAPVTIQKRTNHHTFKVSEDIN